MATGGAAKRLGIYLNDHLAGATAGLELAKRTLAENEGTEFESDLAKLRREIEEDRASLGQLMDSLGVRRQAAKTGAAWAAEKVARLKLNGQLRGYSPLSRVLEIEGLSLGVEGKASMWRALSELADGEPRIDRQRMGNLVRRAERQRALLEGLRVRAAALAFTS